MKTPQLKPANLIYPACYPAALADHGESDDARDEVDEMYEEHGNPAGSAMTCPRCGRDCGRDEVHNGVAVLYGPWGCSCGWSEDSRYDQSEIEQSASGRIDQWGGFTPAVEEPKQAVGLVRCPRCGGKNCDDKPCSLCHDSGEVFAG